MNGNRLVSKHSCLYIMHCMLCDKWVMDLASSSEPR